MSTLPLDLQRELAKERRVSEERRLPTTIDKNEAYNARSKADIAELESKPREVDDDEDAAADDSVNELAGLL